jgi:hypothetical protein
MALGRIMTRICSKTMARTGVRLTRSTPDVMLCAVNGGRSSSISVSVHSAWEEKCVESWVGRNKTGLYGFLPWFSIFCFRLSHSHPCVVSCFLLCPISISLLEKRCGWQPCFLLELFFRSIPITFFSFSHFHFFFSLLKLYS